MIELEGRVSQLEWQINVLLNRSCIRRGVSIAGNVDLWFNVHRVLQVAQFKYELRAVGVEVTQTSISTTINHLYQRGILKRVGVGLYVRAD